jgi:hypothetical protein
MRILQPEAENLRPVEADGVEVLSHEQGRAAHPRRSRRRRAADVSGSDHNHIMRLLALHRWQ